MELLKVLLRQQPRQGTITVCGDQDQSIYSFVDGATRDNFAAFMQNWPDAEICLLRRNYRSTATIVQASTFVQPQQVRAPNVGIERLFCGYNSQGDHKAQSPVSDVGGIHNLHQQYSQKQDRDFNSRYLRQRRSHCTAPPVFAFPSSLSPFSTGV
jgi:superfamily I DNA/RNA helicase